MNRQLSGKNISVLEYGINLSYLLMDENLFSPGEYKMLNGCGQSQLAGCTRTSLNGCIQLIYRTDGLSSFADMIRDVREEGFCTMAKNLLRSICEVENNGFLSRKNLDISFEDIFLDHRTLNPCLIYLPVRGGIYRDAVQFEHVLRANLAKEMINKGFFTENRSASLLSDLQDSSITLKDISARINGAKLKKTCPDPKLELSDSDGGTVFVVDEDRYVIGRNAQYANGVIGGDKAVGRMHCRILRKDDLFFIEDLGSVNGTFLNGERLAADSPVQVNDGDLVRIADRSFRVRAQGLNIKEKGYVS